MKAVNWGVQRKKKNLYASCDVGVKENFTFATLIFMVVVAQSVRASVCGAEGRGFEPHQPPLKK